MIVPTTDAVRKAGFEPYQPGAPAGKKNGYWKGGYEPYYGPSWHEQRRKARERDEYECVDCGKSDDEHIAEYGWELEVHHIVPFGYFKHHDELGHEDANLLSNLVTLCRKHHRHYEERPAKEAAELLE